MFLAFRGVGLGAARPETQARPGLARRSVGLNGVPGAQPCPDPVIGSGDRGYRFDRVMGLHQAAT